MPTLPVATLIPKITKERINNAKVPINNFTGLHPFNALLKPLSYASIILGSVLVWKETIISLMKYLLATIRIMIKINRFPKKVKPAISNNIPTATGIQKFFFLKIALLGSLATASSS